MKTIGSVDDTKTEAETASQDHGVVAKHKFDPVAFDAAIAK